MPSSPSTPALAPAQRDTALRLLQNPVCSMEDVADALKWTLDRLTLFLTSEEGLLLIAQCELAFAVRARVAAAAQLQCAIDALGMMLTEYASTSRNTPLDESKIDTHTLREKQRVSARRAAHLLFRISHYTPRPIRTLARCHRDRALPISVLPRRPIPHLNEPTHRASHPKNATCNQSNQNPYIPIDAHPLMPCILRTTWSPSPPILTPRPTGPPRQHRPSPSRAHTCSISS